MHLNIGEGLADARQVLAPFRYDVRRAFEYVVLRRHHRDGRAGLGLAECVDELHAGEREDRALDQRRGHRRPAVGNDVQAADVDLTEAGVVEQLLEHGRNHQRAADPMFRYEAEPFASLELAFHDDRTTAVDGGQRGLQAGDVVHRQAEHRSLFGVGVWRVDVRQHELGERQMAEHDGFGPPSRACREQQHGRVL